MTAELREDEASPPRVLPQQQLWLFLFRPKEFFSFSARRSFRQTRHLQGLTKWSQQAKKISRTAGPKVMALYKIHE
jgi:hypothetical protein